MLATSNPPEKLPVVIVACQVLQSMLERMVPDGLAREITFMDYGLHRVPGKMAQTLQEVIDAIEEPSLVVLGYGLCGNGLAGLKAGKHALLVPRVDDCIAILLGSREAYYQQFERVPGTYYLTKGWLESGSHPLKEYHEYVDTYGSDDAIWLMDMQYQHYERLALVAHSEEDLELYRPQARAIADFCQRWGMRYEEILGSENYVGRLLDMAATLAAAWQESNKEFVIVPPGGEIHQEAFMS